MPRAARLAAAIKREFKLPVELAEGANGVFDVVVDGALLFSKRTSVRFPEEAEILRLLRERAQGREGLR